MHWSAHRRGDDLRGVGRAAADSELHGHSVSRDELSTSDDVMAPSVDTGQVESVRRLPFRYFVCPFARLHAQVLDDVFHSIWKKADGSGAWGQADRRPTLEGGGGKRVRVLQFVLVSNFLPRCREVGLENLLHVISHRYIDIFDLEQRASRVSSQIPNFSAKSSATLCDSLVRTKNIIAGCRAFAETPKNVYLSESNLL